MSAFKIQANSVSDMEALVAARDLEIAIGEVANGSRLSSNLPLRQMAVLIQFTRDAIAEKVGAPALNTKTVSAYEKLQSSAPTGYIRQDQLIPEIIPISGPTLWRWCRDGRFPKPTRLGPRVTAWKVEDVRAWLAAKDAAKR